MSHGGIRVRKKTTGPLLVERNCIGVGSLRRPHTFFTTDPVSFHQCERCKRKSADIYQSPLLSNPRLLADDGA